MYAFKVCRHSIAELLMKHLTNRNPSLDRETSGRLVCAIMKPSLSTLMTMASLVVITLAGLSKTIPFLLDVAFPGRDCLKLMDTHSR